MVSRYCHIPSFVRVFTARRAVFGHKVVDIPRVSFFPLKCSVCMWHYHCAVVLSSPYAHTLLTRSTPSHVT